MHPSGPCFEIGPSGYFWFEPAYASAEVGKLLGLFNGFHEKKIVYDSAGMKWRVAEVRCRWRRSWWLLFLANTIFNPRVNITIQWRKPETYKLDELKKAYTKAVERDDDILTQFVEAEELKQKIARAQSFADLVQVYQLMATDHTEEERQSA